MMKIFLRGFALVALVAAGPAMAADLAPTYKAPPAATSFSWSGFYLGGDIGGVFGGGAGTSNFFQNFSDPAFVNNAQRQSPSSSAFAGGLHAGYNWQFAPAWVLGIEGDWQWTRPRYSFCRQTEILSEACSDNGRGFADIGSETRSIGTVRARFGQTYDRLMVYGTGGAAFADIKTTVGLNCLVAGCGASSAENTTAVTFSNFNTGWVAGGGIEWMFSPNWTVRAEYLHIDLGKVSNILNLTADNCRNGGPCGATWSRDVRYDTVRAGLSYRFGSP
jgi:outer membrane immunogenic protein